MQVILHESYFRSKRIRKAICGYYATKTFNEAQMNYTTTKKEFLAIIFALDKFRNYFFGTPILVFTYHYTLKYLLNKKDVKARPIRWILLL